MQTTGLRIVGGAPGTGAQVGMAMETGGETVRLLCMCGEDTKTSSIHKELGMCGGVGVEVGVVQAGADDINKRGVDKNRVVVVEGVVAPRLEQEDRPWVVVEQTVDKTEDTPEVVQVVILGEEMHAQVPAVGV